MMNPGIVIPLGAFTMVIVVSIGMPLARAYARRVEQGSRRVELPPETTARFERMEQAIDAIAVEVERISEAQRFTTKLLVERGGTALGAGTSADRERGQS
jgi:hypothetical protein